MDPYEASERAQDAYHEKYMREGIPKEMLISIYKNIGLLLEDGIWNPEHEDVRPYLEVKKLYL